MVLQFIRLKISRPYSGANFILVDRYGCPKKCLQKTKKIRLLKLTCLFLKRKFNETDKDLIINYLYNSKRGKAIFSFNFFDQTTKYFGTKLIRQTNAINFNRIAFIWFRQRQNKWFGQIPEEIAQRSTKFMQLSYSHLKILKLKIYSSSLSLSRSFSLSSSLFSVPMLLDDKILLP